MVPNFYYIFLEDFHALYVGLGLFSIPKLTSINGSWTLVFLLYIFVDVVGRMYYIKHDRRPSLLIFNETIVLLCLILLLLAFFKGK